MQVVGVMPAFVAGVSTFTGIAQGIAGLVLGGGAANSGSGRGRGGRRQAKRQPRTTVEEEQECGEEFYDVDPVPPSPTAASQGTAQDVDKLNKLKAQLEEGDESRMAAIASIRGAVLELAMDPLGCHLIQLALDVSDQKDGADLALELRGHVLTAIQSKHGNYVVQKIIEVLPTSMASFVVEELSASVLQVARHRYGCRILCRLLEHSATEEGTARLINNLLLDARDLSRHAYGYHVVRCILEHGLPEHRHRIATALCGGVQRHAKHRHASFVVEKALAYCGEQARDCLANEVLQKPENILDLARHQFGRHVVSQLVRIPGECSQRAICNLREGLAQVQTSKHGRRLIEELRPQLKLGEATA
jgi:hypothetical protein